MLSILRKGAPGYDTPGDEPGWRLPDDAVWIDLNEPTRAEELLVEQALGVQLPTREEMAEIERSSRLYQEDGATFMTALVLTGGEGEAADVAPVTFVLTDGKLVTIRYASPRSMTVFSAQALRQPSLCATGATTFLNLVDGVVDRTADHLERIAADVEAISRSVFARPRERSFDEFLYRLGQAQTTNAKIRDSLISLSRLAGFASLADQIEGDREHREQLKSISRDVQSILEYSGSVAGDVTFLLSAALGFINIEQFNVSKVFSVVAVVFVPPTLIASIYGMNFEVMPELGWRFGYPFALTLMVSAVSFTLVTLKRRGWL